jgi:hypothetical protein
MDRTVIDRNTVPILRKTYKLRWCTVITVAYCITVNRTVHRRVTTLIVFEGKHEVVCLHMQHTTPFLSHGTLQSAVCLLQSIVHSQVCSQLGVLVCAGPPTPRTVRLAAPASLVPTHG